MDHVDLLNLDIELAEPKALAGFDIERWKPPLVCVEAQQYVRQPTLDYMQKHHYVLVGKCVRVDGMNLYFMPEGAPGPHIPTPKALSGGATRTEWPGAPAVAWLVKYTHFRSRSPRDY